MYMSESFNVHARHDRASAKDDADRGSPAHHFTRESGIDDLRLVSPSRLAQRAFVRAATREAMHRLRERRKKHPLREEDADT